MPIRRRDFVVGSAAWMSGALLARRGWAAAAPANLKAPIQMVEGAAASGLNFLLRTGATGDRHQPESMPGGLGVIDFDGDGWPDLYCVNGATMPLLQKSDASYWNRLYRNNRNGTFTDVTEKAGVAGNGYGMGVAVGDYNNDGHEDLFVLGVHGNQLFHNNGNGTFSDVTETAGLNLPANRTLWAIAAAWIDYDGDGNLDLFISNCCDWTPEFDPICGGMTAETRLYCHPDRYRAESMQLFHNNGDGTFTDVTRTTALAEVKGKGMGIAVADFAGDGRPGLFVANDNQRNLLFRNTKGHGFEETGLVDGVAYNGDGRSISGMGADFGDIDGDGRFDLVMTALKNESFGVFLNRGHGEFDDGSIQTRLMGLTRPLSGWGCGLVDLDNDGWLDFFVAGGGVDADMMANRIFRNVGGKFTDVSDEAGVGLAPPRLHKGAVFADFDRDGRLDAAVTASDAPTELWWNRSPSQHWLQLRLVGTSSNRSAIGAQVTCKMAARMQIRCVTSSVGYASSSDLTLHFGLGEERTGIIEIHWPSGKIQKLGEVAADQRLEIKEPA